MVVTVRLIKVDPKKQQRKLRFVLVCIELRCKDDLRLS